MRAILLNNGKLAEMIGNLGINVDILDENLNGFLRLRELLIKALDGNSIDILHSHRYKENILAASVKKRCGIKRLIQTIHGIPEPVKGIAGFKAQIYTAINRTVTRRYFDRIITVSEDIRRRLSEKLPQNILITMHNAIDPQKIKPSKSAIEIRSEFNLDDKSPLIGAVGRLVPVKGYDLFLQMALMILEKRPDARFILAGDGPLRRSLEEQSRRLNIADKVIFAGFRGDIIDMVNALDIFVFSSYHEGVPMALLEAMSLKKAIVSTAVGGLNEVLENGVSGLLVKPKSADDLAGACMKIMGDANLKTSLENGAFKRVIEHFSIHMLRRQVVSLYDEAVNSL